MSTYSLYVRRSADPDAGPEQTEFPWIDQAVDLVATTPSLRAAAQPSRP